MCKKLINIASILGITLFCNTNTYATTSLKEIFNNANNTVDFTGDVIKLNGNPITDDVESENFMITNNNGVYTTHINTNTLPIPISIGVGV